ncbi:NAD(P)-dependent alcohol dehydrogenase [Desulfopila sp. IMCC35008]|uniref:NAD(P)-dependent alcohol dehydrogenase n=1 Tax=Desulfopila sp. IMCC35008 TaxID=2653858 RepID=UPI0013D89F43|nr:NAD(P)-dependent alcohol dehydrogenase [Desulfopila sp. IMCC35008]
MKAITYRQYGSPDVLTMENIDRPIPDDDEVLVKSHAVSINSWDWDMLTGKPFEYRLFSGLFKPKSTRLHGCDIAGKVEAIGQNVKHFQAGDEVFGDLSENGWGAFSEYVCAREKDLFLKPSRMTFEQAACLSHGGNLAVQGLIDIGQIKSGQKVLINGGCGSTGTLAIQIAKLFDVELTCVDSTEKLEMMLKLGADNVIDYTKENFTRNGQQYDLIFDVKTTRSIFDYQRVLYPNGVYVTVGGNTSRILQIAILGKISRKYKMNIVGYKPNKDLQYITDLFEAGKLNPIIDKCYQLEETAEAFRYFGSGCFKGKIVITL